MRHVHAGGEAQRSPVLVRGLLGACLLSATAFVGCASTSESVTDATVGMNGGFEHTASGLPVNWLVYSPSTVPVGDYELLFDGVDLREGRQSLKFLVRACSATGGWHSPGICQEHAAIPGASYSISFWIKSEGCAYSVRVGGVDAWNGQYQVVDSSDSPPMLEGSWKRVESVFVMPTEYERLRFELSITSAGSLWIDDVRIESPVANGGSRDGVTAN